MDPASAGCDDNNPVIGRRHQSQQRDLETEEARQDLLLLRRAFNNAPRGGAMRKTTMMAMMAGLALSAGLSLAAAADEYGPFKVEMTSMGKLLTDAKGMTLYTYDKDAPGVSNCSGECAEYWPPAKAEADAKPTGDLTIIKRADGTMQWADNGKPLYTFVKDKKPGDVMGDNMKNVWHVVKEE
jgi:predicted lipoprotein with Yx(FWY)xxD motif